MIYVLSQIIENSATQYPDKDAFRFHDQSLTYAELKARMNQLAQALQAKGVRRGDRVGIFLHKSLESAIAIYGIMHAGAAYVPLDPKMPPSRLEFILRDCEIRHLISEPSKVKTLQKVAGNTPLEWVIGVENIEAPLQAVSWDMVYQLPETSPEVNLIEQDMAYLMYTSGSTGEPKGMVHTHKSGLSYAKLAADVYELTDEDRLSNFPPLHFDQSTFDYFSGPLVGATTVIIPEEYTLIPASLSELMERERLSVWYSVPFALIQLLLRGALESRDLSSLRWILYGGEPFPPKHMQALMDLWPNAQFSNVYGPAEVNQCTIYNIPKPLALDQPIPIGTIWPNTEGLIVDEDDEGVAVGEVGELLIRTPTMMQGYWRRPDLNERAFYYRAQPSGQQDVFYRTGDLVQVRPDGLMDFLGRKDRQVKTRGYRVELDEVEAALLSHDLVEEAAVFPVTNDEGTKNIHAAVICRNGEVLKKSQLIKHLSGQLARYAIPTQIDMKQDFPRTSSGKIDRRALQAEATGTLERVPEVA